MSRREDDDDDYSSLLVRAIREEHPVNEIVAIIDRDPTSVQPDMIHRTFPLHEACSIERHKSDRDVIIMKILMIDPETSQVTNNNGDYPLHIAIENSQDEHIVMKLLELFPFAATTRGGSYDSYPLHLACEHMKSEIVIRKLVEMYPTALQETDNSSMSYYPIHSAISGDQSFAVIKLLIEAVTDPVIILQQIDFTGRSPLQCACGRNRIDIVDFILQFPTMFINLPDTIHGDTALQRACRSGHLETVQLLVQHPQLDIHVRNDHGDSAFHVACSCNKRNIVQHILQRYSSNGDDDDVGLIINTPNKRGVTPLHEACWHGYNEIVAILLQQSSTIRVNAINDDGETPLSNAVRRVDRNGQFSVKIIQLLLNHPDIIIDPKNHHHNYNHNETSLLDRINRKINELRDVKNHDYQQTYLPLYSKINQLFEDFCVKRKWQSYEYFFTNIHEDDATVLDLPNKKTKQK